MRITLTKSTLSLLPESLHLAKTSATMVSCSPPIHPPVPCFRSLLSKRVSCAILAEWNAVTEPSDLAGHIFIAVAGQSTPELNGECLWPIHTHFASIADRREGPPTFFLHLAGPTDSNETGRPIGSPSRGSDVTDVISSCQFLLRLVVACEC